MSGSGFLWRWSLRLVRLEWRQHVVIAALLAAGVAVGVGALVAVFNLAVPPSISHHDGRVRASVVGDAGVVDRALTDQGHRYGTIRLATAPLAGTAGRLDLRSQAPDDPVTEPLLDLVDGRWPTGSDEVAITEGVARQLGLDGRSHGTAPPDTIALAGDVGAELTVVGLVENPTDLGDEFALAPDLAALGLDQASIATQFWVDARPSDVTFPGAVDNISVESSGGDLPVDTRTALTLLVNVVTLLALLEATLLAGAGFAILARRRARQFGLLGAIGAGPAQLRRAAAMGGVIVGLVGSTAGVAVGLAAVALVVPRLEGRVGHRIDLAAPWWTVAPTAVLAVVAAGLAARWPTRRLSTEPVARSLAAARPRATPAGRSAAVGVALAAVGAILLVAGTARLSPGPAVAGLIIAPVGVLLATPAVVAAVARLGAVLPLPARLAARALGRQRARSAAVVAALLLALGLPVGLVAVTTSIDRQRASELPNLTPELAIAWLPGADDPLIEIPADLDAGAATDAAAALGAAAPTARIAPIEVAVEPGGPTFSVDFESVGARPSVMPAFAVTPIVGACLTCDEFAFGDRDESGDEILFTGHEAWVATPELLAALGLEPGTAETAGAGGADGGASLGLSRIADARLVDDRLSAGPTGLVDHPDLPAADRVAPVLLWPEIVTARGWETRTVGWLLVDESGADLAARVDELRVAAGSGLAIETRVEPEPRTSLRLLALLVGGVTALAVVAAAVALEVAEGAADRRLLAAIGAAPAVARNLSAAGAALLAGTGALLALPTGYLALVALLAVPGVDLPVVVPWSALALLGAVPPVAATIGWLGAARSTGAGTGSAAAGGRLSLAPALLAAVLVAGACAVPGLETTGRETDAPTSAMGAGAAAGGAAAGAGCEPGLDAALSAWADVGFAGSVAVLDGDRPCIAAYGSADPAAGRPNTVDTVFSIGSVAKAVTAAAILDLIDRGLLDFDDPVGVHRADLDGPVADLTIRQLLLHTGGLVGAHGRDHEALGEEAAVAAIAALDLGFPAGRQYLYSNAGYSLLALVIEAVTDVGFRRYVTERVLVDADGRPLGGFWDGQPAAVGPRAVGFLAGERPGHDGDFDGPHWALDGNGGVAMTAADLADWTRALFTGDILSARATGWLTSTTTNLGPDVELPGWVRLDREVVGEVVIGSSGGGGSVGHSVDVAWLPESQRVLVVAVNRSTVHSARLLDHVVPALVAGTGIPGPTPVPTLSEDQIEHVAGTWSLAGVGRVVIEPEGDGLMATAEGAAVVAALLPVPSDLVGEAAAHEELAVAFARGDTAEGRRQRQAFEDEFGVIERIEVDGTVFAGELVTHLLVHVAGAGGPDGERPIRVALALDGLGGVQGAGIDGPPPSVWLVGAAEPGDRRTGGGAGPGDAYVPFEPARGTPSVTLRSGPGPEGDRLTIEGPEGSVVLERVAG